MSLNIRRDHLSIPWVLLPVTIQWNNIMELMEATTSKMGDPITTKDFSEVTADDKITLGNPYYQIEDEMVKNPASIVVMDSGGATGTKEVILGSNAEKIIRDSKVPVIILHSETNINSIINITFASDFEEDPELVNHLSTLQEFFDAKFHLLKVNIPAYFACTKYDKNKIDRFIKRYELINTVVNIYNDEQEEVEIRNFALATRGRKGLDYLLLGSVAEDVANRTTKPVWAYKVG